mmetsp:Transcript_37788/g.82804  ORF Transcript_37788/g.82804 Transcript_37788/m.82804 type:complete len:299 (-) Transcript_37788:713-1609(-)
MTRVPNQQRARNRRARNQRNLPRIGSLKTIRRSGSRLIAALMIVRRSEGRAGIRNLLIAALMSARRAGIRNRLIAALIAVRRARIVALVIKGRRISRMTVQTRVRRRARICRQRRIRKAQTTTTTTSLGQRIDQNRRIGVQAIVTVTRRRAAKRRKQGERRRTCSSAQIAKGLLVAERVVVDPKVAARIGIKTTTPEVRATMTSPNPGPRVGLLKIVTPSQVQARKNRSQNRERMTRASHTCRPMIPRCRARTHLPAIPRNPSYRRHPSLSKVSRRPHHQGQYLPPSLPLEAPGQVGR